MNKQIIEFAQKAGFMLVTGDAFDENAWFECFPDQIERFAELVAEQTHTNNKAKWYQEGYEAGQRDTRELMQKERPMYYIESVKPHPIKGWEIT
jgi:flagellar biosynthesis/type III secretory pathway protein FliH